MHSRQRNALYDRSNRSKFGFTQSKTLKWRRAGQQVPDESPDNSPNSDEEEASRIPTIHAVTFSNISRDELDTFTNLTLRIPLFVRGASIVETENGKYFCYDENAPSELGKSLVFQGEHGLCDSWSGSLGLTLLNFRVPTCAVPAVGSVVKDAIDSHQRHLYNLGPIEFLLGQMYKKEVPAAGSNDAKPVIKDVLSCCIKYANKNSLTALNVIAGDIIQMLNLIGKRYQIPIKTRRGVYAAMELTIRKYDPELSEQTLELMNAYNKTLPREEVDICATKLELVYSKAQHDCDIIVHDAHGIPVTLRWNPEGED